MKKKKIEKINLTVNIPKGWFENEPVSPDPNMFYGQLFIRVGSKINEIIERLNENP